MRSKLWLSVVGVLAILGIIFSIGGIQQKQTEQSNITQEFDYRFVKESKISESSYYPDIEYANGKLYASFFEDGPNQKVVYILDENLSVLEGPINLEIGPDHEIVYLDGYFYLSLTYHLLPGGQSLLLVKYDENFNEISRIFAFENDNFEESNDQFFSVYEGKLYNMNLAYPAPGEKSTILRVYDKDLNLLSKYTLEQERTSQGEAEVKGHIAKMKDGNWVIIGTDYTKQNEEIRLLASIYDNNFNLVSRKNITSSENYEDHFQLFPYDMKKVGDYYFVTHRSTDRAGGKTNAHGYLSIFDENLALVRKIKITDHDENVLSLPMIRFCISENKIFFIYTLHDATNIAGGGGQRAYIRVFEKTSG